MSWTRPPRPAKQIDYTPRPRQAACTMEGVTARAVVAVPKPAKAAGPKPRACKKAKGGCGGRFVPAKPTQEACSLSCAQEMARAKREQDEARRAKESRAKDRAAREEMKTKPQLLKEAQIEFNRYIRFRDAGKSCICCNREFGDTVFGGAVDAGHYRSVGSAPHLRFNEDNCHAQLAVCNRYGSGRAVDYRMGLIRRIGISRVEELESNNSTPHWSKQDIRDIRDKYRAMSNQLKKGLV